MQSWLLAEVLLLLVLPCQAEVAAQAIALNCMSCHQLVSAASDTVMPALKSLSEQQIQQALLDFKYDKKNATLMPRIAKGYSDSELIAVAEFLSRQ